MAILTSLIILVLCLIFSFFLYLFLDKQEFSYALSAAAFFACISYIFFFSMFDFRYQDELNYLPFSADSTFIETVEVGPNDPVYRKRPPRFGLYLFLVASVLTVFNFLKERGGADVFKTRAETWKIKAEASNILASVMEKTIKLEKIKHDIKSEIGADKRETGGNIRRK
jgi:hypothetical protein